MQYSCSFCEKTFQDSYNLFKHINTHTVQWNTIQEKREERFKIIVHEIKIRDERFIDLNYNNTTTLN